LYENPELSLKELISLVLQARQQVHFFEPNINLRPQRMSRLHLKHLEDSFVKAISVEAGTSSIRSGFCKTSKRKGCLAVSAIEAES